MREWYECVVIWGGKRGGWGGGGGGVREVEM